MSEYTSSFGKDDKLKIGPILLAGISPAFIEFLQSVVIAIVICIVIYIFIATPNQIEGSSMEDNFHNGEIVLTSKLQQWLGATQLGKSIDIDYHRGDVIVFQKPGYNDFIKRVIGMPGDEVSLKNGKIYINQKKLNESYLPESTLTSGGNLLENNGEPISVPPDSYFVLGDNRGNSHDSRYLDIGFVSRLWMKGKVVVRYWPLNKIAVVSAGDVKLEN